VRHHDDPGAALREVLEGRDGGPDSGVVRDITVRQGYVEVLADKNALASDVDIGNRSFQSCAAM